MLRKLTDEREVYDTAALLFVEWDDHEIAQGGEVIARHDLVEDEQLSAAQFLRTLVRRALEHTPIDHHLEVRNRLAGVELPVEEGQLDPQPDEDTGPHQLDLP